MRDDNKKCKLIRRLDIIIRRNAKLPLSCLRTLFNYILTTLYCQFFSWRRISKKIRKHEAIKLSNMHRRCGIKLSSNFISRKSIMLTLKALDIGPVPSKQKKTRVIRSDSGQRYLMLLSLFPSALASLETV